MAKPKVPKAIKITKKQLDRIALPMFRRLVVLGMKCPASLAYSLNMQNLQKWFLDNLELFKGIDLDQYDWTNYLPAAQKFIYELQIYVKEGGPPPDFDPTMPADGVVYKAVTYADYDGNAVWERDEEDEEDWDDDDPEEPTQPALSAPDQKEPMTLTTPAKRPPLGRPAARPAETAPAEAPAPATAAPAATRPGLRPGLGRPAATAPAATAPATAPAAGQATTPATTASKSEAGSVNNAAPIDKDEIAERLLYLLQQFAAVTKQMTELSAQVQAIGQQQENALQLIGQIDETTQAIGTAFQATSEDHGEALSGIYSALLYIFNTSYADDKPIDDLANIPQ